jgi:hypothetical protein
VPPNKELKLTKPSNLELRSLTPVLGGPWKNDARGAYDTHFRDASDWARGLLAHLRSHFGGSCIHDGCTHP